VARFLFTLAVSPCHDHLNRRVFVRVFVLTQFILNGLLLGEPNMADDVGRTGSWVGGWFLRRFQLLVIAANCLRPPFSYLLLFLEEQREHC
jgi:hypothetical protein